MAAAAAKNTIGSRLVIARNMVIRLGNGSVALISTLAEVWWWRTNTGVVSRAGTGCARHNDNGHMLFDNLYRWPRFGRRAQLALARISIGRANVQNHHQQRRFARSMCVLCPKQVLKFKILQTLESFTEIWCLRFVREQVLRRVFSKAHSRANGNEFKLIQTWSMSIAADSHGKWNEIKLKNN